MSAGFTEMRTRDALNRALREELANDPSVIVMGEDIGAFGGAFAVTKGLLDEFGPERIMDTPISENSMMGIGIGAAIGGLKPVTEMMTINFALLGLDQVINSAAHARYMFGGQTQVPWTLRMPQGAGHQLGPTHSHSWEAMYAHVPGLLVAVPATPADAYGMLKTAIREPNPVVFIEQESLYGRSGPVPDQEILVPFGQARIAREGNDITLWGCSRGVEWALEAADLLQAEGVSAEVIDPRTLRPLDVETVLQSVAKTNLLLTVEEGWPRFGVGAEIIAQVTRHAFDDLDGPPMRITAADVPMPYAKNLEQLAQPSAELVAERALELVQRRR
jgi:pyruvate dehydrogenase E1 component beta subunit